MTSNTPILFKRDTAGNIREWRMELAGDRYRTVAGLLGGVHVVSQWTIATPKNVGRSNATTVEEQAQAEVAASYEYQLAREYFTSASDIDQVRFCKPMLAGKYAAPVFPVYSQPKLDGIRCLASVAGLHSREGQPILSCPHIMEALTPIFTFDPTVVLDGEIYNHDYKDDFNAIISAVRRDEPTPETRRIAQYHVYDIPNHQGNFGDRSAWLQGLVALEHFGTVVLVDTELVETQDELDRLYADYLEDGYEGQMVRLDKPYEQKRSKTLLKRKEFLDGEFKLLRIEEGLGNWSGVAKRAVCQLPDGREFEAGIKGTKVRAAELLHETWETATVRFFGYTPAGKPRFGVAVAFHNGVRM